jgi:hypothetical protein
MTNTTDETHAHALSDEMFATLLAALSMTPQNCAAYKFLDEEIKRIQPKWIRRAPESSGSTLDPVVRLSQDDGIVTGMSDVGQRIPMSAAGAQEVDARLINLGGHGSEHDHKVAAPTGPHRSDATPGLTFPDEPSEEHVTAALRAACFHDTRESRKDMRNALIAAAGVPEAPRG